MNRSANRPLARLAAASALLMLAACGSREEAEPAPSPSEGPRSIFEQDAAKPGADGDAVTLPPLETTLGFPDGTAELSEAARAELVTVLRSPQMGRGGRIVLRGHSDSDGSDEANLSSSLERAEAVRDFLLENGVAEERIKVIAFGEQNPVEPNALPDGSPSEAGRAANRRVEVTVETGAIEGDDARKPTLIETITSEQEDAEAQSEAASE